MAEFELE